MSASGLFAAIPPPSPATRTGNFPALGRGDNEGVRTARDIIKGFEKVLWAKRMYDGGNVNRQRIESEFQKLMQDALQRLGDIPLKIAPREITFGDDPVYKNDDRRASLAFRLYRDGVRSLAFARGISDKEIDQFCTVLNSAAGAAATDRDLATMLWESNFRGIRFGVVEEVNVDENEGGDGGTDLEEDPVEGGGTGGNVHQQIAKVVDFLDQVYPTGLFSETVAIKERDNPFASIEEATPGTVTDSVHFARIIYPLEPTDIDRIKQDVLVDPSDTNLHKFTNIFFRLIRSAATEADVEALANVFSQVVEGLFDNLDFGTLNILLEDVRRAGGGIPMSIGQALNALLESLLRGKHGEALRARLAEGATIDCQSFERFLTLAAVDPFTTFLNLHAHAANEGVKTYFRRHIFAQSKAHVDDLIATLQSPNLDLASVAVEALDSCDDAKARAAITSLGDHESPHMRKLALISAAKAGGAKLLLVKALRDPELELRMMALKLIIKMRERAAAKTLKDTLVQRGFSERSEGEQTLTQIAFAMTGGSFAETHFKELAAAPQRGWFNRGVDTERAKKRVAAYEMLALVDTPGAKEAVSAGALDEDPMVSRACTLLLQDPGKALKDARRFV